ncbi:MAG: strawberry notch C-terminal domain-containing protein [Bacteroidota bacterium]
MRKYHIKHYSREKGLDPEYSFLMKLIADFEARVVHNKRTIEKLAAGYGITDRTKVKELAELAIIAIARMITLNHRLSLEEKFAQMVNLYESQVNLSHRTSRSTLLQQYSTPVPLAFMAGVFAGLHDGWAMTPGRPQFFEPSAGNGMLTIAAAPEFFHVNEVDDVRRANLERQGFELVTMRDASEPFPRRYLDGRFDAVITNPPFGSLGYTVKVGNYSIKDLDQRMAILALDTIKDGGRAAIIVGGHHKFDRRGRLQKGKNRWFFNYLYHHYYVSDVLQINGDLYSRMGTRFPIRLILIAGRKPVPYGAAPLKSDRDTVLKTFDEVYERIMEAHNLGTWHLSGLVDRSREDRRAYPDTLFLYRKGELYYALGEQGASPPHTEELDGEATMVFVRKNEYFGIRAFSEFDAAKFAANLREKGKAVKLEGEPDLLEAEAEAEALCLLLRLEEDDDSLEGPYRPSAQVCKVLNTVVPDSMDEEIHSALAVVGEQVGMPLEEYVSDRLGYATQADLCAALSAEQVDAVALAIYNIEYRGQGMIIGDQTGIGKGRVAAAMIRFGVNMGLQPVFLTEKTNLFSDLYRDLKAIGAGRLNPFIVNTRESKSHIKDSDGTIIYKAPVPAEQKRIIELGVVPDKYDFIMATYTQFNADPQKGGSKKQSFLRQVAKDNLMVLDESHNASGDSQTGNYLKGVVQNSRGVTFLSATYAKRPANMPVYAMKTAISDANLSPDDLIKAIRGGGVALQEVVSAQLVSEGQMIRRERSFEGIEVNYITLDQDAPAYGLEDKEEEHRAIADNITDIMRDIIAFQREGVTKIVDEMDEELAEEGKEIRKRGGTSYAGIDNPPYFSKVFQIINQMLMAIKAESTATLAIKRLREGKKPVIAFSSTMEAFFDDLSTPEGFEAIQGDVVRADFASILRRGLDGVRHITITDHEGGKEFVTLDLSELPPAAQAAYYRIVERIKTVTSGITLSPIDHIKQLIEEAGYSVAEVTGRSRMIRLDVSSLNPREVITPGGELKTDGMITGVLLRRPRINVNDAFRKFNDNEVDVLMINQSGSTGASAHAIPTDKVPLSEVRQRVMIVLQPELDINTEVQKRGRINRTGQVHKPIYDYVISAIPAEKRLMMMLQKKLKSLDANTSSNQKQSEAILKTDDFLNKYGNKVVATFLNDYPDLDIAMNSPRSGSEGRFRRNPELAHLASGRVAVLSTRDQDTFYNEVVKRYNDYVRTLKQEGKYDLEVEVMDLQARKIESYPSVIGVTNDSVFGDDTMLERVEVRNLRKPFTGAELSQKLIEALGVREAKEISAELQSEFEAIVSQMEKADAEKADRQQQEAIAYVPRERAIRKIKDQQKQAEAILARVDELKAAYTSTTYAQAKKYKVMRAYMGGLLAFFYIGRAVNIPVQNQAKDEKVFHEGVFLGFAIDRNKANPFAPSAVTLRFAVASAVKYLTLTASGDNKERVLAIKGATTSTQKESKELIATWDQITGEHRKDWQIRFIATGNLLQAVSKFNGKLVSYTTREGRTRKGLLLPENFTPTRQELGEVRVPLVKAVSIFESLPVGKLQRTDAGVGFIRKDLNTFEVYVAASKKKGGKYYQDEDLIELVSGQFEKTSNNMIAKLPHSRIGEFLRLLQEKFSDAVTLGQEDFMRIKDKQPQRKPRRLTPLRPRLDEELLLAEAEAEALLLLLTLDEAA